MKKYLLLLLFVTLSFSTAFAVEGLNPYAYNLSWQQTNNNRTLQVSYCLNAPAKSVTIEILNEQGNVAASFSGPTTETKYDRNKTPTVTPNVVNINMAELVNKVPMGTDLQWRIKVTGTSPSVPTKVSQTYNIYCPQGVAVDNNPMSENFGRILFTETLDGASVTTKNYYTKSPYEANTAGKIKAGVYALSPDFRKITENSTPEKGGNTFTQVLKAFSSGYGEFDGGHQPWQVCISEDSRIFVSSGDKRADGVIVWELSQDLKTWTPVIKGTWDANWQMMNGGNFYAGFNCSMDVKGSGDNLTLLLYSATQSAVKDHTFAGFVLAEYPLGTAETFTGTPTIVNSFKNKKYGLVYDKANVIYDGEGGFWFAASRAMNKTDQANLVHVNKNGVQACYEYASTFYGGAGVKVHKSSKTGAKWLIKGTERSSASNGRFHIYSVSYNYNTNKTTYSEEYEVITTGLGRDHNAFAIDYAENLFVVGNRGEKIQAYALPYVGHKTTPAKQAMKLTAPTYNNIYTVTINIEGDAMATVTGAGQYIEQDQVTVTAIPSDPNRYEFVKWVASQEHTENPFTFTITGDVTITAVFKEKVYKVEYFNLFESFQDVTDYFKGEDATMDKTRNTRIYRWFQVAFNEYADLSLTDKGKKTNGNGNFRVTGFLSGNSGKLSAFLTKDNTAFYWLGKYINHVNKGTTFTGSTAHWQGQLDGFFNRSTPQDDKGNYYSDYGPKTNYNKSGKPDYWRTWWQQYAIKLDTAIKYDDGLPIKWNKHTPPSLTIKERDNNGNIIKDASGKEVILNPGAWYQWNYYDDKLLGWCYGSKDPSKWENEIATEKIVHNVYKDGNLLAVWLDKKLREEKDNYDVTKLLKTNTNNAHAVSVYRPLQAGMYNTICLPFSLSTLDDTPYEGATVLKLNTAEVIEAEDNDDVKTEQTLNIYFTQVTFQNGDIMEAGVPYLIQPLSDIPNEVTFTVSSSDMYDIPESGLGEVVHDIVEEGQSPNIAFHGVISPTHLPNSPHTLILVADNRLAVPEIVVDDSEDENVAVLTGDQMLGLRGYFTLQGAAAAQSLAQQSAMHIGKKVTTDTPDAPEVEEVETTQPAASKTRKVMYNGNIYILRGDEVYTLSGHRVK